MKVWTSRIKYPGPYALDITVKGQDPIGKLLAPSWAMVRDWMNSRKDAAAQMIYVERYHELMVAAMKTKEWAELLKREYIVLLCYCGIGEFCHRHLAAHYLTTAGAVYCGEITDFSKWGGKVPDILEFTGKYDWLSNFAPCMFTYQGVSYDSTESFYQAWKFSAVDTLKIKVDDTFIEVNARKYISRLPAGKAKRMGSKAKLCWNWDTVRVEVMKVALEQKFVHTSFYRALLRATGNALLVEGNWWHDNFWGDCSCVKCAGNPGANTLGKLIMAIRATL